MQSVAVLVAHREKILLIEHRTRGDVSIPGGRKEKGETDAQTCVRECEEETGIEITKVKEVLGSFSGSDYECKVYACDAIISDPVAGDDAVRSWFGFPSELTSVNSASEKVFIAEYLKRRQTDTLGAIKRLFRNAYKIVVGKSDLELHFPESIKRMDDLGPSEKLAMFKCFEVLPVGSYDLV